MNKIVFILFIVAVNSSAQVPSIRWQKCFGGTGSDAFSASHATIDGGVIFAGGSDSNDGDVSGGHGQSDFWVLKLDSVGNIEWQKCYGGSDNENAFAINTTLDHGYI